MLYIREKNPHGGDKKPVFVQFNPHHTPKTSTFAFLQQQKALICTQKWGLKASF
ncbi:MULTISPECIES: hypothetical protein [unclassified Fibrobacter]|uniref:hypothetical protein n=1 Tax=Fibrobacter sp. UWCM TaxID=1896208 RepID=UPI001587E2B4|nr:hypothetical protein [Fibrobacter sp. UWCM]MBR2308285.1 hypothetical protein [Fibrobacter sp.]